MTDHIDMADSPAERPWRPAFRGGGIEAAKRVLFLGFLILVMLIPLGMVEGVVQERQARKLGAIAEMGEQWGPPQELSPPILVIPYDAQEMQLRNDGTMAPVTVRRYANFLPAKSRIDVTATDEKRHRSIYETRVYTAKATIGVRFDVPDFNAWGIDSTQIRWREASLAIPLAGARALGSINLRFNGVAQKVEAGLLPHQPGGRGLRADLTLDGPQAFDVDLDLLLKGRESLYIQPLGGQSEITVASVWAHPSFIGTRLPDERDISAAGFTATWSVNHLATGIPLAWRNGDFSLQPNLQEMIGIGLVEPGDVHQQTDRVVKYALLIVALTFGTIFVVGLLKRDRVHLVQYLLIGAALTLFYLLLLSLAEQIPFAQAYLIASLVDIAIVGIYAGATIRRLIGWVTGLLLAMLHGYMFVLLQMESYALLAGTIGLLVLLVAVMIFTRKIDWFAIGEERGFNPK